MPTTTMYACSRCKREFNFNNVKYDENKLLICLECLDKRQKLGKKKLNIKITEPRIINFICVSCRFKFLVKKGSQKAIKCPYCGNTKLMLVRKYKDENDLINDSMDSRYDY